MKAKPEWISLWQADPQAPVTVIIHVEDNPRAHAVQVSEHGMAVIHAFRLTRTIAARGPAGCVLDLLQAAWVTKIEPDQKITTMS